MTRSRLMLIVGSVAALILLLCLRTVMYTVDERELAVILEFGKPVASRTQPGLYFKMPLIQEVIRLPKTLQLWSSAGDPLGDMPTADGKKVEVNAWAVWRISDPERFVKVMRSVENAQSRVTQFVRGAVRDTVTAHDLAEVVRSSDRKMEFTFHVAEMVLPVRPEAGAEPGKKLPPDAGRNDPNRPIRMGRRKIVEKIKNDVQRQMKAKTKGGEGDRGIELVDVGISDIDFVPEVRKTAFTKQIAVMATIAADNTSQGQKIKQEILNRTNAEVQKLEGEGVGQAARLKGDVDAEVIESYAKAIEETGDFYNFLRTLEAYSAVMEGDTRLILTTDSALFRLLKEGPAPAESQPTASKE